MKLPKLAILIISGFAIFAAQTAPAADSIIETQGADHDAATRLRPDGTAEKLGYHRGDTAIVIPAWVRALPDFCFAGCDSLRYVTFESGSRCVSLGVGLFAECTDLRQIELPVSLRTIGEGAFRECRSLRSLSIPEGVWQIPKEMCLRCPALETVSLPASLREIRDAAFCGDSSLREISFPPKLNRIGANAFSDCRSLTEVNIPSAVKKLESYAFSGCTALRKATLPDNFEALGELIFSGCTSLREITEPTRVPPSFECESYLFDPTETEAYARCTLRVPADRRSAYADAHAWHLFKKIKPIP